MINLIIQNTTTGEVLNISTLTTNITWTTHRRGKAEELNISMVNDNLNIAEGSIVSFRYNNENIFYGYVFKIKENYHKIDLVCYSQLIYLKNKETYVFKSKTATEIITKIANDFELKLGELTDTIYKIPSRIEDANTLLDIINNALDLTLINSGNMFYMWDNFGKISVSNVTESLLTLVIGDKSLMTDFQQTRDISSDTYNKIKLVKDNKVTGKRDVYIKKDSSNIAKWGIIQYYEKVQEKMNEAQIIQRLDALAQTKNRVMKSLDLDSVGDITVRAGKSFFVQIDRINLNTRLLCESATHRFENGQHTMSLEMRVI